MVDVIIVIGGRIMGLKTEELRMIIDCPHCKIPMERVEIEVPGPNVYLDYCGKCDSYWFDKGEFKKVVKDKLAEREVKKADGMDAWANFDCPRCGGFMTMKYMYNVEVDQCTECFGIWLDEGELLRLNEKHLERIADEKAKGFFHKLYTLRSSRK